jgi:hypothetical protein
MNGRKVSSNEKRLLRVMGIAWSVWTGCCILVLLSAFREIDAEKGETAGLSGSRKIIEEVAEQARRNAGPAEKRLIESKSDAFWVVLIGWVFVGSSLTYGGYMAFWKAKYQVDYEGSVIEVAHSWPRKQLFVDGELQDERADFEFGAVVLHGRVKRGEAADKQMKVLFAAFGSLRPICVIIDNRVVFRG